MKRVRVRQRLAPGRLTRAWLVGLLAFSAIWVAPEPLRAAGPACVGSIGPQIVAAGSSNQFEVLITNVDATLPIRYFQVEPPAGYFTAVSSASAGGWSAAIDSNGVVTFSGGQLDPGDNIVLNIDATAFNGSTPGVFWYTRASDQAGGAGAGLCDGDFNTEIVNSTPPPVISGLTLSALSAHSVTISWETDTPTDAAISYVSADDAGAVGDPVRKVFHSFTLAGLKANSSYTFTITVDDGQGNVVTSADNQFLTPLAPPDTPAPVIIQNVTIGGTNVPGTNFRATPTERVAPSVTLANAPAGPVASSPSLSGLATDNDAVARIEYSVDGGLNWAPVDAVQAEPGARRVRYQFRPPALADGNYALVVRAVDASGNVGVTAAVALIIDRLSPEPTAVSLTFGPHSLQPTGPEGYRLVAGATYRLVAGFVGGPVNVLMRPVAAATPALALANLRGNGPVSAMSQDDDTGLWNGTVRVAQAGRYQLVAEAVDGANNRTVRVLGSLSVAASGRVTGSGGQALETATLSVFVREPSSGTWQLWQGSEYGQQNPQATAGGNYRLVLPAGEYYLRVVADHYQPFTTSSFKLDQPRPITATLKLSAWPRLRVGPWQWELSFWPQSVTGISLGQVPEPTASTNRIGPTGRLPNVSLSDTAGSSVKLISLEGRPTVVSFVTTWSPETAAQLPELERLAKRADINVVPIFSGQSAALAAAYLASGGYDIKALADPDGVLTQAIGPGPVPRHILMDRGGTGKAVMFGVVSEETIMNQLGGL